MQSQKALKILLLALAVFLLAEMLFRLAGYAPGVLSNDFVPVDSLIYQPTHVADAEGITHYLKHSKFLPPSHVVNNDGFIGLFDYDPSTVDSVKLANHQKTVMLIGDSYTEGWSADTLSQSFAGLLGQRYTVLNFGIGATDPLQYRLVAEKYIPELKPDLVVVCVYLGNDIMTSDKIPHPFIPCCYRTANCGWLNAVPPYQTNEYAGQYFRTAKESYDFNLRTFTLFGKNRSYTEALFAHSVILSRGFLCAKLIWNAWKSRNPYIFNRRFPYTAKNLRQIRKICNRNRIPALFVAIPSPKDVMQQKKMRTEYDYVFEGVNWSAPDLKPFNEKDYISKDVYHSHFNAIGHRKYFEFLQAEIDSILQ